MADEKQLSPTAHLEPAAKPTDVAPDEQTVTMIFPRRVVLTLDNHKRVVFEQGIQEVPVSLSTNVWLERHGARVYTPTPPTSLNVVATAKHVEFLQSRGHLADSKPDDVAAAQSFIDQLSVAELRTFNGDFDNWKSGKQTAGTGDGKKLAAATGSSSKLPDVSVMTKQEIVDFAKQKLNLDLDVASKKDDLIAAVRKAAEASASAA